LADLYEKNRRSLKTEDALEVVARLRALPDTRTAPPAWRLATPASWAAALADFAARSHAA
jgi:hypothetical protein